MPRAQLVVRELTSEPQIIHERRIRINFRKRKCSVSGDVADHARDRLSDERWVVLGVIGAVDPCAELCVRRVEHEAVQLEVDDPARDDPLHLRAPLWRRKVCRRLAAPHCMDGRSGACAVPCQ